ncbi:MAG: carboxypeptidase-like regulatory domain-containing protein, partial [Acidobacteria bacterium]|nr:carboxypeptidase-like regulatory domain-containing protein [Acidobacteriota bacterium]
MDRYPGARYLFLIVAALLASSSSLLAASISGTVTAAENGRTLSGIVVAAYSPDGTLQAIATSDSFGRYTLTLPAGQTRVLAYDLAGTYATNYYLNAASFETSTTFDLTQSQGVSGVNISMVRGGRITGKVVADGSGMALPEMTVAAYTPSGIRRERVQSDQAGNFSLLLPPGDYILAAWDEQQFVYLTEFYSNVAKASLATIVRVAAGTTLSGRDFSLAPGATVSGSVRDHATGNPLTGITVSAYSSAGELLVRTVSDSSGRF